MVCQAIIYIQVPFLHQACTNPRCQWPRWLNFVPYSLVFVGSYYETCFMSLFRHPEFWGWSWIFGKICALLHISVANSVFKGTHYYDPGVLLKVLILLKYFCTHIITWSIYTLSVHYHCRLKLSQKGLKIFVHHL